MKLFLITTAFLMAASTLAAMTATAQVHVTHWEGAGQNINRIQLTNTPLADAVSLVADLGRVEIYLDRDSISAAGISLRTPVTASIRNSSVIEILAAILPTGLTSTTQGLSIVISTKDRIDSGKPFQLESPDAGSSEGIVEVARLAIDQAFSRTMPVHFEHMPLEMAVQMLAGMAGKQVVFDSAAGRQRFTMVTLHRDDSSIRTNLDDLLKKVDLDWEVSGHAILIKARSN